MEAITWWLAWAVWPFLMAMGWAMWVLEFRSNLGKKEIIVSQQRRIAYLEEVVDEQDHHLTLLRRQDD